MPIKSAHTPFVNDINFYRQESNQNVNYTPKDSYLFQKLLESHKNGHHEVQFKEKDFTDLINPGIKPGNMQFSVNCMFKMVREGRDSKIQLKHLGGNSAIDLLGRFSHLNNELYDLVLEISEHERQVAKKFNNC